MKTSTRCVHFDDQNDPYATVVPPIYQTATFRQPTASEFGEYDYTRSGNPTRALLERQLADLEGGAYACAFASGMAAITALTRLVNCGEEIIVGDDLSVARCGCSNNFAGDRDRRSLCRYRRS
jgi:cystathionine beta-lyase